VAEAGGIAANQDAELVAAEAVRPALRGHRLGQGEPEPAQQQVSGRVPEGVVVGLEAVEVEDREQGRARAAVSQLLAEVGDERAPVGEPGADTIFLYQERRAATSAASSTTSG